MRINNIKKIHFIGIGGIGVSATAKLMALEGKIVTGSDCQISNGHDKKNLASNTDLVVYSLAIPPQNPELQKAKRLKIPMLAYPEFLGSLMQDKFGIAVAGTNGKSTTTAMIGFILEKAELDPTVVIGSKLKSFGGNARLGKGKCFVAEADEYRRGFLNLYPHIAVVTNIEKDHLDYYKNLEDIISAFREFASHIKKTLIINGDDKNVLKAINPVRQELSNGVKDLKKVKIVTFGQKPDVDVRATDIIISNTTNFKVSFKGKSLGEFRLRLPGIFNIYNALGAIGVSLLLGIPAEKIKTSLSEFSGLWRRFEQAGKYKRATIISDYAHHPIACKFTIEAAHQFYPRKKIIAVFQPHQHSRTKKLFKDFVAAFDGADLMILSEIFDVAGREKSDQDISSRDLAQAIRKRNKRVLYGGNLEETKELIVKNVKANDVVLVMGAGDIYKLANDLVKN